MSLSREDLERMRSVAFNSHGPTHTTHAGTAAKSVTETTGTRTTVDELGATIVEHSDGRQDVNVVPIPANLELTMNGN